MGRAAVRGAYALADGHDRLPQMCPGAKSSQEALTPGRDLLADLYPEVGAGGFSRVDGTVAFYQRVNALLDPSMTVADFGAGRGRAAEDPAGYRRDLQVLRGKVASVVGLDIDEAVQENPNVDRAHVVTSGQPLILEHASVDLIVSDFTFEHVTDPGWAAGELTRILRPGGWLCARTPNRWGYIGIPTRLVPNRFHDGVLQWAQPQKQARDTFPTAYRLNSWAQLRRHFPVTAFDDFSYAVDSEPAYFGSSRLAWRTMQGVFALTPPTLRSMLFVFLRKKDVTG